MAAVPAVPISAVAVAVSVRWARPPALPSIRCPHASPAGATVRRVGIAVPIGVPVIAVPIRAPIVISIPAAVECVGSGSHAVTAASRRPSIAASAAVRPTTHDVASAAMRSTAASALSRRRTQRRAAHRNRRGGQTNRYPAHHDAHSIRSEHPSLSESNSAISDELQRCGTVARVRIPNPSPKDMVMKAR
jgi:hypothetical protein